MNFQRGSAWTAIGLSLTLALSELPSVANAQQKPAVSAAVRDGRYLVYVNGIT